MGRVAVGLPWCPLVSVTESLQSVVEQLRSSANVTSVYGDPVERDGKTVIPIAKIAYGFGMGFGRDGAEDEAEAPDAGGGGVGMSATPIGVLEVTDAETRFIRFGERRRVAGALVLGLLVGLLVGRRR